MDSRPSWLKDKMPGLHRFLTRGDKPYPAIREFAVGALIVVAVLGTLWGYTGQPLGRSPIVVVESGSMMHCTNGFQPYGRDCEPTRYGRLGTIDPGDLILVKDVDGKGDVATRAGGGDGHYGHAGDVIVYRPDGDAGRTPIIHRAMFWLEIHGDGTYSVPALGLERIGDLDRPELQRMGLRPGYAQTLSSVAAGPEDSGFITRGDNNQEADQAAHGAIAVYPVKPEWILGKARGEIPWLGLVKLLFADSTGTSSNFANAGGDSKLMLFVTLALLLGGPYAFEKVRAARRRRREGEQAPPS